MSKDLFLYKYMYIYNIYRGTQKSTAAKCVQSYQSFVVTYVQWKDIAKTKKFPFVTFTVNNESA